MQHVEIRPVAFPVAMELLAEQLERLLRDHFDEPPTTAPAGWQSSCSGCARAFAIRDELERLGDQRLEI